MEATGTVGGISDLGRVVIPKEIRHILGPREGTPLETFTGKEREIILKKYSPMIELTSFMVQYTEAVTQSTGLLVCIMGRDQIIAAVDGAKKDLFQRNINRRLEQVIDERNTVMAVGDDKAFIQLVDEELEGISAQAIVSIICKKDTIGAATLMSREARAKSEDMEVKLAVAAVGFLGRQIEG